MKSHPFYAEFKGFLEAKDRLGCVESAVRQLSRNLTGIVDLYEQVLAPSLKENFCAERDREVCVWEEHLRTSIIRTVIESCYLYVIKERKSSYLSEPRGKAVVFCPQEEYHEIGARMVTDFLTLSGFEAVFIGANTTASDITEAVAYFKPEIVAMSVSNYFNLVAARRAVAQIKSAPSLKERRFKLIAGGIAFSSNPEAYHGIGADAVLHSFEEIRKYAEGFS